MRPAGLHEGASGTELDHKGLDVQYRCSVDGIKAADPYRGAIEADEFTGRQPEAVRSVPGPLGKDADLGPDRVVSR